MDQRGVRRELERKIRSNCIGLSSQIIDKKYYILKFPLVPSPFFIKVIDTFNNFQKMGMLVLYWINSVHLVISCKEHSNLETPNNDPQTPLNTFYTTLIPNII